MLAKLHSLSQQVRWFPRALMIFFLFLEAGNVVAFENPVAVTHRENPTLIFYKKKLSQ